MNELKYPVGPFKMESNLTDARRAELVNEIAVAPAKLRQAVEKLSPEQLETPYRPGGWTVRQVVHHLPDSHMNAYMRLKLALTEQEPTIRPFDEKLWAELPDARTAPIEISLALLESVHHRWVHIWRGLSPADYQRTFRHPEHGVVTVEWLVALYAWHGRHHVAHITSLAKRMGWG